MNRKLAAVSVVSLAAVCAAIAGPAYADPQPADGSFQTSVCDNGETYVFPLRTHGADGAQADFHTAQHVPGSNTVLTQVSTDSYVSFLVNGTVVDGFAVQQSSARKVSSGKVTTCHSTYDAHLEGGVQVHVEGTDVFVVSGQK